MTTNGLYQPSIAMFICIRLRLKSAERPIKEQFWRLLHHQAMIVLPIRWHLVNSVALVNILLNGILIRSPPPRPSSSWKDWLERNTIPYLVPMLQKTLIFIINFLMIMDGLTSDSLLDRLPCLVFLSISIATVALVMLPMMRRTVFSLKTHITLSHCLTRALI